MNGSKAKPVQPNPSGSQSNTKAQKNFMWNDEKSAFLIQCLVDAAAGGLKVDKSFKRRAFVLAANAVSEKFGEPCQWTKVENRLKTLKKQWATILNLKNLSGSVFDPLTKTIKLGEGSHQDYVKAHPKDSMYLNVPIQFYDELAIICGDDQATGEFAMDDLDEVNLDDVCGADEDANDMDCDEAEENEENPRVSNKRNSRRVQRPHQEDTASDGITLDNTVKRKKRKGDQNINNLVDKLEQIADCMIDPTTRRKKELLIALNAAKSNDANEEIILQAYSWLLRKENEIEADVFLARSEESRRSWLFNFMLG